MSPRVVGGAAADVVEDLGICGYLLDIKPLGPPRPLTGGMAPRVPISMDVLQGVEEGPSEGIWDGPLLDRLGAEGGKSSGGRTSIGQRGTQAQQVEHCQIRSELRTSSGSSWALRTIFRGRNSLIGLKGQRPLQMPHW